MDNQIGKQLYLQIESTKNEPVVEGHSTKLKGKGYSWTLKIDQKSIYYLKDFVDIVNKIINEYER